MPEPTAKRPLALTLIAWLFILTGVGGFISHAGGLKMSQPFDYDALWPCGLAVVAITGGVFMLRGANWARWVCLGWMACHVVISGFHSLPEAAVHSLVLAVLFYLLLRRSVAAYFESCRDQDDHRAGS